jgi:hypothetical protein
MFRCDESGPYKKAALILLKTNFCDQGSQVCAKSLITVSDVANIFIQENFKVYHTRFYANHVEYNKSDEKIVRETWNKPGLDPEFVIIDLTACKVIARDFFNNLDRVFDTEADGIHVDFEGAYRDLRHGILKTPAVAALFDGKFIDENETQIHSELLEAELIREHHPQPSIEAVLDVADKQLRVKRLIK